MAPDIGEVVTYRLAPAIVLRAAGAALVILAVLVVGLGLVAGGLGWDASVVVAAGVLGAVLVAAGAWWAVRRAFVVRMDQLGYDVRLVRGAGVKRARWADVADCSTADIDGAACVVLSLRDGRSTVVPVSVLAGDRDEFVTRLREHLRRQIR